MPVNPNNPAAIARIKKVITNSIIHAPLKRVTIDSCKPKKRREACSRDEAIPVIDVLCVPVCTLDQDQLV